MNKDTLNYAVDVINNQYAHYMQTTGRAAKSEQLAYYKGMFDMLNIIISEAHTTDRCLYRERHELHFLNY